MDWTTATLLRMYVLQAGDGVACHISDAQLQRCHVLGAMSPSIDDVIPLSGVSGTLLTWLCTYLANDASDDPVATRSRRGRDMVDTYDHPFDLLRLAHYLDIPSLYEHACRRIACGLAACRTLDDAALHRLFAHVPDVHVQSLSYASCEQSFARLMAQVAEVCVTPMVP